MSKDRTWNSVAYSKTLWASSHSDKDREINDYYATEPKATELLLQLETFNQKVWECACWEWHMSEVLKKHWHNVYSTDLIDRWYWEQLDFLNNDILRDWDIITNPPYKYANQFIEQCLKKLKDWNKFAFFLPIRYTEWKERKKIFTTYPPKVVYVSSSRLKCAMNWKFDEMTGSAVSYAWFVREKGFKGDTTLKWFN